MADANAIACSAVLASAATSSATAIATMTPTMISTPTATGSPHSAPPITVVATTSTIIETTPTTSEDINLPTNTADLAIGAIRIRSRVPSSRSCNRLSTPNCTVKNRKNTDSETA